MKTSNQDFAESIGLKLQELAYKIHEKLHIKPTPLGLKYIGYRHGARIDSIKRNPYLDEQIESKSLFEKISQFDKERDFFNLINKKESEDHLMDPFLHQARGVYSNLKKEVVNQFFEEIQKGLNDEILDYNKNMIERSPAAQYVMDIDASIKNADYGTVLTKMGLQILQSQLL